MLRALRRFLRRYLRPEPPLALAPILLEFASAAMDISDGLIKDCGRLVRASGVAGYIEGAACRFQFRLAPSLRPPPDLFRTVMTGGDDYQVLAAVPADRAGAFRAAAHASGVTVTEIGGLAEERASRWPR